MDLELTEPLPTSVVGNGVHSAIWILARLHTEPIGKHFMRLGTDGMSSGELGAALWAEFGDTITGRYEASGLEVHVTLDEQGLNLAPDAWPFLRRQADLLGEAPLITVIICIRGRPESPWRRVDRLEVQEYPRLEVVVVDKASSDDTVRTIVDSRLGRAPYRYVIDARAGLSWVRSTEIAVASGDIIAFLDDDGEPDAHWLAGLAAGFTRGPRIWCVTGLVVPAQLQTQAQILFEQIGGHGKGRGFTQLTFSSSGPQNPLYPLPPFGTGVNIAFKRETLAAIGGFDVALGAGTPAAACEDMLALTLTLLSGYEITYEPAAMIWHNHRLDLVSLCRQLRGYSIGLTAFYAALLRHRPSLLPTLLKLLPYAVRYLRNAHEPPASVSAQLATLNRQHLRGLLTGPWACLVSLRVQQRIAKHPAPNPSQRS